MAAAFVDVACLYRSLARRDRRNPLFLARTCSYRRSASRGSATVGATSLLAHFPPGKRLLVEPPNILLSLRRLSVSLYRGPEQPAPGTLGSTQVCVRLGDGISGGPGTSDLSVASPSAPSPASGGSARLASWRDSSRGCCGIAAVPSVLVAVAPEEHPTLASLVLLLAVSPAYVAGAVGQTPSHSMYSLLGHCVVHLGPEVDRAGGAGSPEVGGGAPAIEPLIQSRLVRGTLWRHSVTVLTVLCRLSSETQALALAMDAVTDLFNRGGQEGALPPPGTQGKPMSGQRRLDEWTAAVSSVLLPLSIHPLAAVVTGVRVASATVRGTMFGINVPLPSQALAPTISSAVPLCLRLEGTVDIEYDSPARLFPALPPGRLPLAGLQSPPVCIDMFTYQLSAFKGAKYAKSQTVRGPLCLFCGTYCGTAAGLIAHLTSTHDRCVYDFEQDPVSGFRVLVTLEDAGAMPAPGSEGAAVVRLEMLYFRRLLRSREERMAGVLAAQQRIQKRILLFKAFVELCRGVSRTTASLAATTAEARQSAGQLDPMLRQMTVPKQFYHSKTGMPILPNEVDCDSDDDVDESWITNQSDRLIDDFEDVTLEEKEFMKLWNRHIYTYRVYSDRCVPGVCVEFCKRDGATIMASGLRYNLLLHLLNLWDNALVDTETICVCMRIVDST